MNSLASGRNIVTSQYTKIHRGITAICPQNQKKTGYASMADVSISLSMCCDLTIEKLPHSYIYYNPAEILCCWKVKLKKSATRDIAEPTYTKNRDGYSSWNDKKTRFYFSRIAWACAWGWPPPTRCRFCQGRSSTWTSGPDKPDQIVRQATYASPGLTS